jgi:hypothetical protein
MMVPVTQFVACTEPLAVGLGVASDVDDGTIPESNDLRFAADERAVFDFDVDTPSDSLQVYVDWLGNPEPGQ